MKNSTGILDIILDVAIVGGILALLYFWWKNRQKNTNNIQDSTPASGKVSVEKVTINGLYWFTYINEKYDSKVNGKTAGRVVESIVEKYRNQPQFYDEIQIFMSGYKDMAEMIVNYSLREAIDAGLIVNKPTAPSI